jgi:transcriptional regulator with XRE-family HTH domain
MELQLREVRKQRGMRPREVRRRFQSLFQEELSSHRLWRWEDGRTLPDVNDLWRMARVFDVPVDALYRQSAKLSHAEYY